MGGSIAPDPVHIAFVGGGSSGALRTSRNVWVDWTPAAPRTPRAPGCGLICGTRASASAPTLNTQCGDVAEFGETAEGGPCFYADS